MSQYQGCWKFIVTIIAFSHLHICYSNFNYEVSELVKVKISDYLELVSKAASQPYTIFTTGLVNISNGISESPRLFFPSMLAYNDKITSIYIGLENGIYYGYGVDDPFYFSIELPSNAHISMGYNLNFKNGIISTRSGYDGYYYYPERPWYKQVKKQKTTLWSTPYIDSNSYDLVVTFMVPILNYTNNNQFYTFFGTFAADIYLTTINHFLESSFKYTNKRVFLVDRNTGNLIGNSWGAPISISNENGTQSFVTATSSTDYIISASFNKLLRQGFPSELILLDTYYLQSTLYVDAIPGIEWWIIVLLPATIQLDYIGPDSTIYYVIMSSTGVAIIFIFLWLFLTIRHHHSRLFKLTRPIFTKLILTGGLFLCCYCILSLHEHTPILCALRPWVFNLAFTMSFSPLLIKSWRVYSLFIIDPLLKKRLITNFQLLFFTFIFVFVDAILISITIYAAGHGTSPISKTVLTTNGAYDELTHCRYLDNQVYIYSELMYKGGIIVMACYYSYKIKHITGTIASSNVILITVYNTACVSTIVIILSHTVNGVIYHILIQTLGICFSVILTSTLLVFPTYFELITKGDKDAADDVLADMFVSEARSRSPSMSVTTSRNKGQLGGGFSGRIQPINATPPLASAVAAALATSSDFNYINNNSNSTKRKGALAYLKEEKSEVDNEENEVGDNEKDRENILII